MTTYPLEEITESQLRTLGGTLWSWRFCSKHCHGCALESCSAQRSRRLHHFFNHVQELTCLESPFQDDVFAIVQILKSNPDVTRAGLTGNLFQGTGQHPLSLADRENAVNIAIEIITTLDCTSQRLSIDMPECSAFHIKWPSDMTYTQFILDAFPSRDNSDAGSALEIPTMRMRSLMATKLKKRLGLRFQPTDNLRRHMRLDLDKNVLEIYSCTALLKEHLRLTKDKPKIFSVRDGLRL